MVKRRKSVLILAFAVILSFISASRLSACNVTQVNIWAGTTPTDALKVHSPTSPVYILKGSTAYFYGEATANPDPQHRQLKWTYSYGDGSSPDIHYTAYKDPPGPNTASHAYTSTGAYTITLTVERVGLANSGASNTCLVTVVEVNLSQTSPSGNITRGDSATFTASFNPSAPSGTIKYDWKFTGSDATIRDTDSSSSSWSGTMVNSGTVSVQVKLGGGNFGSEKTVTDTVIARTGSNWELNDPAKSPIAVPGNMWPASDGEYKLGRCDGELFVDTILLNSPGHVTSGPNKDYWYILANNISVGTIWGTCEWWVHTQIKYGGATYVHTRDYHNTETETTLNTWVTQEEAHETDGSGPNTWGHHKIITDRINGNANYDPKTAVEAIVVFNSETNLNTQFSATMDQKLNDATDEFKGGGPPGKIHPNWGNGAVDYFVPAGPELPGVM